MSNRYLHKQYLEFKKLIAERENISLENIILGAGSTEVMTTLIHFYSVKGEALSPDPTYFDLVRYAEQADSHTNFVFFRINRDGKEMVREF